MRRIGILLDDLRVRKWQKKIIDFIEENENLKLEVLILNSNTPKAGNSSIWYRIFQAIDRKIFKTQLDAFEVENLELERDIPFIQIKGKETKYSFRFLSEEVKKIEGFNLDVLIRFGFGILKGEILDAAREGVWSLHHGDSGVNRGGPPGFWEVVNKEEVTGVTLQRLSEDLDGGGVIHKAYVTTDLTSFYRNKNKIFWAGVDLFNSSLINFNIKKPFFHQTIGFYSYPLYKDPRDASAIKIHLIFWFRRVQEVLAEAFNPPQWFLLYKFKKDNSLETSIFRYKTLFPPKGFDWADPFVIKHSGDFFVFFEELEKKTKKGHISYFHFNSAGELISNSPTKVLEENFHLSYPHVWQEENIFYMIPEAAESRELWLYQCENFPDRWVKKIKIFDNKLFFDPTILKKEGVWYLFGTEVKSKGISPDAHLVIYTTENLSGEWKLHRQSPIYNDPRISRPAGKFFSYQGRTIRPSQICAPRYGYGINFNEIEILNLMEYKESPAGQVLPKWNKKIIGTHTFNFVDGFAVLDAQGYK